MDYLYKPGDKVRVIDHFEQGKFYRMNSGPDAGNGTTVHWSYKYRQELAGKIVTIGDYDDLDRYTVKESDHYMIWSDEMFVGLVNKPFMCNNLL